MSSEKVILSEKEIKKINKALHKKMSSGEFFVWNKELAKEIFVEDILSFIKNY